MRRGWTIQTFAWLDPALRAVHSELPMLILDLPDSDREPVEKEHAWLLMLLLLGTLQQYWHGRPYARVL